MARLDGERLVLGAVNGVGSIHLLPAAVHWEHPNLWSWRELRDGAPLSSTFVAFFVADPADAPVDTHGAAFRAQLGG